MTRYQNMNIVKIIRHIDTTSYVQPAGLRLMQAEEMEWRAGNLSRGKRHSNSIFFGAEKFLATFTISFSL